MRKRACVFASVALAIGLYVVGYQPLASVEAATSVPSESSNPTNSSNLSPIEKLGKAIFFDTNLSVNGKQSCATCHGPEVGFSGPDSQVNSTIVVYPGAIAERFGNRKPPVVNYAGDSPVLHIDEEEDGWIGGMFWDGRATGATLGDPLTEQAQGPFLNPMEQAMPDARLLAVKVAKSEYAELFEKVWGPGSLDFAKDVDGVYERIARSIAAYERSAEANPFTSKFDVFWDKAKAVGKDVTKIKCGSGGGMGGGGMGGGMACGGGGTDPNRWTAFRNLGLTDAELRGLAVFNDSSRADCASCHSLKPGKDGYPLFTDFTYDNLGIPKNPDNPFYSIPPKWNPDGKNWVDFGLGGYLKSAGYPEAVYRPEMGKFKVPTLRNVDLRPYTEFVKAYGHNGYFESLEEIVMFYAWRGMMTNCGMGGGMCNMDMFPEPEVSANVAELNHFPMMEQQNIVAFLKTLSDGHFQR